MSGYFPVKSKVHAIIGLCSRACLSAVFLNAYAIIIACNVCLIVSCCSFSGRGIVPRTRDVITTEAKGNKAIRTTVRSRPTCHATRLFHSQMLKS